MNLQFLAWSSLLTASLFGCTTPHAQESPQTQAPAPAPSASSADAPTEADRQILADADAIEQEVAKLRGRPFTAPVAKQVYARAQLADFLTKSFAESDTQEELRRDETFLRAIGFLPTDVSLGALYQDMFQSQIAGFYDPEDKTLRCISSDLALVQRVTMVHEIYHSLQDQYFPLDPYITGDADGDAKDAASGGDDAAGGSDGLRARQAVVEGDAQFFTMNIYMRQNPRAVVDDLRNQSAGELFGFGLEQALAQASIPPYLAELLTWPYLAGASFIGALYDSGGWEAVDRAFTQPPQSSEQILHPAKYLAGSDTPLAVTAPLPAFATGRTELLRDTLGEATIATLLNHMGQDLVHATRGSEGWGGDEVLVLRDAAGAELLVWKLAFDSARDAEQFFAAWRNVIKKQYGAEAAAELPTRFKNSLGGMPDGASVCVAEPDDVPPMWLLQRGKEVLVLRGSELARRPPADLVELADGLAK